ncbi:MAG: hypothetical protein ACW981_06435 [Candidatus Hodarchaeales archaeon]|jgi:hypothetical protein
MTGTIAWTRLTLYLGASLLLLVEIYRLMVILLALLIIAPGLIVLLQNIIQWGLLIGFSTLTLGFYRLLISNPPLLDPDQYSEKKIKKMYKTGLVTAILLILLSLLPPIEFSSTDFQDILGFFISVLWISFYLSIIYWIVSYWMLEEKKDKLKSIIQDRVRSFHISLGIILVFFWIMNSLSLILTQKEVFLIGVVNISYIIILILFLVNQILFYYRVSKFSYLIYG